MAKQKSDNGKGDSRRKEDLKKIQENWPKIKGFKPSKYK